MKFLIIGGAGMLGHQCFQKLKSHFGVSNVGCTLRKSKDYYKRFGIFETGKVYDNIDVTNFTSLEECLETFKPNYIINCIGLTLRKPELSNYDQVLDINSMLPHKLSLWGLKNSCKIIHFSTDCVFDGKLGDYTELSLPSSTDLYGKSKFLGEVSYPNSLTIRLSIVGRELESKTELIEWFLSQKNTTVKGYSKVMYSGLTTNFVADEVIKIIKNFPNLNGLYQISSQPISKFDLLKIVNEVYQNNTIIEAQDTYESNKALNCEKYRLATDFTKPTWTEMIKTMKKEESFIYDL